jgi:hypothetical protein
MRRAYDQFVKKYQELLGNFLSERNEYTKEYLKYTQEGTKPLPQPVLKPSLSSSAYDVNQNVIFSLYEFGNYVNFASPDKICEHILVVRPQSVIS